jgi:hypothetical protein
MSGGYWHEHPAHEGSCVEYDNWRSPWELPEVEHEILKEEL